MRGGWRPNAGRPRGAKNGSRKVRGIPSDMRADAARANMTPLAFMLSVMNDPDEDDVRRDRAARNALPFCHPIKRKEVDDNG